MSDSLLILLKNKMVADAYQYYAACAYKLGYAQISYQAIENVMARYEEDENARFSKSISLPGATGLAAFIAEDDWADFLGVQMDATCAMDKLSIEVFGLLHSFFDAFAQWMNAALLGENACEIRKAYLSEVCEKIVGCQEYAGNFIDRMATLTDESEYVYISDLNNTLKHRHLIHIDNRFDLIRRKSEVSIPAFARGENIHPKERLADVLKRSLDYCNNLLTESRQYVEQYYAENDNKHVSHRVYNPEANWIYESEDDYAQQRPPETQYHYIDVDPNNILEYYQIMLCQIDTDRENDLRIKLSNSPHDIIVLREKDSTRVMGILKPADHDTSESIKCRPIMYRRYNSVTTGSNEI